MTRAAIVHAHGPFVGARPFRAQDRRHFLGRSSETEELVRSWSRHRLTVLHGDNGVGKTSLVRAGAVPTLTDRGSTVLPQGELRFDPGFPAAILPGQNPYSRALLALWSPSEFPTHGPGTSISDYLRTHESTDRQGLPRPVFAVLDQTELLLRRSVAPEPVRRDFLDELFTAVEHRTDLHLLLTVRTQHLDELRRLVEKREVDHAEVRLTPFAPGTATDVVARALALAGSRTAARDADLLVDQTRTARDAGPRPGPPKDTVEPALLQFLGRALWERASESGAALVPDADSEVDRLLTERLAGVLAEVADEHLVSPEVPYAWLRAVAGAGPRGVGRPACEDPDSELTPGVVHALEDRHLVTANRDGSAYLLRHPKLAGPLVSLSPFARGPSTPSGPDPLEAARAAHTRGETALAAEHARRGLGDRPVPNPRERALLTALLGDLAFERGDHLAAAANYADAARQREAVGDGAAVSRLLVAEARNRLMAGERSAGLTGVAAAEGRVHADPSLRAGIGQVLWLAGQGSSALDVLEGAMVGGGGITEARRTRGEIRAEQRGTSGKGRN
ncbi:ATP-binding protein [Nocardiopsis sp. B62]|uniref:nSTAND1 domain-containing NTPase n=1 Tax=Nocardiopsis sp. B62 TaxID=2824874 RepID=UPI001B36B621|nr:ATP-binding protein [Nocardiopsis sp. B62]MBQ1080847.1 ATP-binding protein [Nocardiopsis sp. B62]